MSHPSRVRGLKLEKAGIVEDDGYVAPFTGAWIEMLQRRRRAPGTPGRTLHGCVD